MSVELGPHDALVCAEELQRARAVARFGERLHQLEGHARPEAILRGKLAPPRDTVMELSVRGGTRRQRFERAPIRGRELRAHRVGPLLERRGPIQKEALQEWPVIQRDGRLEVGAPEGRFPLGEIARDDCGIEAKRCTADCGQCAKRAARLVQQLVE